VRIEQKPRQHKPTDVTSAEGKTHGSLFPPAFKWCADELDAWSLVGGVCLQLMQSRCNDIDPSLGTPRCNMLRAHN